MKKKKKKLDLSKSESLYRAVKALLMVSKYSSIFLSIFHHDNNVFKLRVLLRAANLN